VLGCTKSALKEGVVISDIEKWDKGPAILGLLLGLPQEAAYQIWLDIQTSLEA
jgi:hypothetical protein